MKTEQFPTGASASKVRFAGALKLIGNLGLFVVFCYGASSLSSAITGLLLFIYFSWKLIPVIVTGMPVEQTSARARGTTILLGLVFIILIIISIFLIFNHPDAAFVAPPAAS